MKLTIHLGCLPITAQEYQLFQYFSQFGCITHVIIRRSISGQATGIGTVDCGDEATYSGILYHQDHIFQGRKIFCTKLFKGRQLKEKREELEARRLFISNIAYNATDQQIFEAMSYFGPVQNAYRIVKSDQVRQAFGFVTFQDEVSAKRAAEAGFIYLKDRKMKISSFKKPNSEKMVQKETQPDYFTSEQHTIKPTQSRYHQQPNQFLYNHEKQDDIRFVISKNPKNLAYSLSIATTNKKPFPKPIIGEASQNTSYQGGLYEQFPKKTNPQ